MSARTLAPSLRSYCLVTERHATAPNFIGVYTTHDGLFRFADGMLGQHRWRRVQPMGRCDARGARVRDQASRS